MGHQAVWALGIFLVVYAFIISGKVHRTVAAMAGALLAAALGMAGGDAVIRQGAEALGLLVGMMILVTVTAETGVFRYAAFWAARKAKADPVRLLIGLSLLAAVGSALLNQMMILVLMVPLILQMARLLQVSPFPFLAAHVAASGAGGTATLIGSVPNVMIGSAVKELKFTTFLAHLAPISVLVLLANLLMIVLVFRKRLQAAPERKRELMAMDLAPFMPDRKLLAKCMAAIGLTILGLFLHDALNLEPAVIALAGACLLLLLTGERITAYALSRVEWTVIFSVAGMITVASALAETGVAARWAEAIMGWTGGHILASAMLILWTSAVASAFTDNIPLVAAAIPLIQQMGELGASNLEPLWWSLALGAGLGGSGTLAGAGLAMAGLAAKEGHAIRFVTYMKVAFPLMLLSMAFCSVYVFLRYLM